MHTGNLQICPARLLHHTPRVKCCEADAIALIATGAVEEDRAVVADSFNDVRRTGDEHLDTVNKVEFAQIAKPCHESEVPSIVCHAEGI